MKAVPMREVVASAIGGGWGSDSAAPGAVPVRVIRGADFPKVVLGDVSTLPLRYEAEAKASRRRLADGDIVVEVSGGTNERPTGRSIYVTQRLLDSHPEAFIPASFCRRLRIDPALAVPRYVYYWLQDMHRSGRTWGYQVRSTGLANFQFEYFLDAERIALPALAAQQVIADMLGALDDKIGSNERIVRTALDLAEFGIRSDLSVGGVDWERAWPQSTLGEVLEVLEAGKRPTGGVAGIRTGIPSIGAESIVSAGVFDYSKVKRIPEDFFHVMKRGVLEDGDVLLYKDGGVPGRFEPHVSIVGHSFPFARAAINEHVYRLRIKAPFNQAFLYFWLRADGVVEEMRRGGTGVAIPGINSSSVRALPIILPPRDSLFPAQARAGLGVDLALTRARESRTVALLRDALLPELLSGRIRFPEAQEQVEAVV